MWWVLLGASAWAQDGDGSGSGNPAEGHEQIEVGAHEQITVYDMRVAARRQEIVQELRLLGYTEVKRENGRSVFRSDVAWHPDVLLYDDGFMMMRRPPPRFAPPDKPGILGSPIVCLALLPCTHVGGWFVSGRKLEPQKSEVALDTHEVIEAWRTAVMTDAMKVRLDEDIPALLDAIWLGGIGPEGQSLPDAADRRKALLDFWATRSDTPEGDEAKALAATYVEQMVETSDTPLVRSEIEDAEKRCGCRLDIVFATPARP